MISKSKVIILAAIAAAGVASAEYIRNFEFLLFIVAQRFYDAHVEKVQMRLAPTRRAGVRD